MLRVVFGLVWWFFFRCRFLLNCWVNSGLQVYVLQLLSLTFPWISGASYFSLFHSKHLFDAELHFLYKCLLHCHVQGPNSLVHTCNFERKHFFLFDHCLKYLLADLFQEGQRKGFLSKKRTLHLNQGNKAIMKSFSLWSSIFLTPIYHGLCKTEGDHEMWVPYVHLEVWGFYFIILFQTVSAFKRAAVCNFL